jgi:Lon protease-like protein
MRRGIERLPERVPLFPLSGVLLLPRGRLPLNIFEPRYVNMLDDALAGDRLIGMIQPTEPNSADSCPALFKTGCAGRITSFNEDGNRYQIVLTGIMRFDLESDELTARGYRLGTCDWGSYLDDIKSDESVIADRPRLIAGLKAYFHTQGMQADWDALEQTSDSRLTTSLAMVCPFDPAEKQALLQANDIAERAKILTGLVEIGAIAGADGDDKPLLN